MCEKSCLILTIMMCSICLQADISRVFFNVLMKALHNVDDGIQIYSYTFLLNILVTLNFWYKFIDAFFLIQAIMRTCAEMFKKCEAEYIM